VEIEDSVWVRELSISREGRERKGLRQVELECRSGMHGSREVEYSAEMDGLRELDYLIAMLGLRSLLGGSRDSQEALVPCSRWSVGARDASFTYSVAADWSRTAVEKYMGEEQEGQMLWHVPRDAFTRVVAFYKVVAGLRDVALGCVNRLAH
jgi:hypothetical protein